MGPKSKSRKRVSVTYKTQVGKFQTKVECVIGNLKLPPFTTKRSFEASFDLFEPTPDAKYDLILGRNTLQELGVDILYTVRRYSSEAESR